MILYQYFRFGMDTYSSIVIMCYCIVGPSAPSFTVASPDTTSVMLTLTAPTEGNCLAFELCVSDTCLEILNNEHLVDNLTPGTATNVLLKCVANGVESSSYSQMVHTGRITMMHFFNKIYILGL